MYCKYCEGDHTLIDATTELSMKGDFYPGITVGVDNDELWISSISDTYEPSFQEASIKIKFCPMCGRKLTETATDVGD